MTDSRLLTLREAARRLSLTPQRVVQLIDEGLLDGPTLAQGRNRHPPDAGRVTTQSVENLIRLRVNNPGQASARRRTSPDTSALRSVRAAVLDLKVQLDVAREALASEREVQANLLRTIESLAAQQRAGLDNASRLNRIADGYSTALGHLVQMDPEDVQTRS